MRSLVNCIAIIIISSTLASCGGGGKSTSSVVDKGNFKAKSYESSLVGGLKDPFQKFGNEVVAELNRQYKLPSKDVLIVFKDCGTKNAFYDRNKSQVVMCYELLIDMIATFNKTEDAESAYIFVLMHELSHAFVHQMSLPIVGKEEDSVDSISTVLLIEDSKSKEERQYGARAAILGGSYLLTKFNSNDIAWTDTHSIGPQRLYNLVCWAGAGEPSVLANHNLASIYGDMAGSRFCKNEYTQIKSSTIKLLSPYRKVKLGKSINNEKGRYPKLDLEL